MSMPCQQEPRIGRMEDHMMRQGEDMAELKNEVKHITSSVLEIAGHVKEVDTKLTTLCSKVVPRLEGAEKASSDAKKIAQEACEKAEVTRSNVVKITAFSSAVSGGIGFALGKAKVIAAAIGFAF